MTTPNNHVLIDYENVQPEVASRLAPGVAEQGEIRFAASEASVERTSRSTHIGAPCDPNLPSLLSFYGGEQQKAVHRSTLITPTKDSHKEQQ